VKSIFILFHLYAEKSIALIENAPKSLLVLHHLDAAKTKKSIANIWSILKSSNHSYRRSVVIVMPHNVFPVAVAFAYESQSVKVPIALCM
jgi:hypothetical protein